MHNKNKAKILLYILLICIMLLTGCETEIPTPKMNIPLGLTYCSSAGDKCIDASNPGTKIDVYFWAYNSEANFTGYNVYIGSSENDIRIAHENHISGSGADAEIDTSIEANYIIKNENGKIPTITKTYLATNNIYYHSQMSVVKYEILNAKSPIGTSSGLWLGVSAFSLNDKNESELSNLIQIP